MWLIDTLSTSPLTFSDIQKKWLYASANEDGDPLFERTFNRYRREAESLMYVDIKCDKSDGNLYKIVRPEGFKNNDLQEWLLSAFRIANLAERVQNREDVMIEQAPPGASHLQIVMDAIDRGQMLSFTYKSHYKDARKIEFFPAFVRLFEQRWYVIGDLCDNNNAITCALERISEICIVDDKPRLLKGVAHSQSPEQYFEHCFGIIRQHEPIAIRFRAFWPQDSYLRDVPLHASQVEILHTDKYTDFEIFVRPTYDLKQKFLWCRDKLAVLSPESFRKDMINIIKATLMNYETGDNHDIDE